MNGAVTLTHWGVIRARGADAATFLHNQLTNDFTGLSMSQARLAGYCSAKGRLLASFVAWKAADDEILLACHASVLPATLKRLSCATTSPLEKAIARLTSAVVSP